jgi:hypothetical protein
MVGVVKFGLDGFSGVGLVWFGLVWFVSDNVRQVQWCLAFGSFVKANLYNLAFAYLMFISFGSVWFNFFYHPCLVWLVGP